MTDLAKNVVAGLLGFITGILVYPEFDKYVVAVLAFLGAVAVGVLVFALVRRLLDRFLPTRSTRL